jgi:hypothetical protein
LRTGGRCLLLGSFLVALMRRACLFTGLRHFSMDWGREYDETWLRETLTWGEDIFESVTLRQHKLSR